MIRFLNLLIGLSAVLLHDEATLCVFSATGEGIISDFCLEVCGSTRIPAGTPHPTRPAGTGRTRLDVLRVVVGYGISGFTRK